MSKSLLALNMFNTFITPYVPVSFRLEWLMQEYSYRLREFERSEDLGIR